MTERKETFIVVAYRVLDNGITNAQGIAIADEMEAHDVAEAFIAFGHRAFFINTSSDDGTPTIEEYGLDG